MDEEAGYETVYCGKWHLPGRHRHARVSRACGRLRGRGRSKMGPAPAPAKPICTTRPRPAFPAGRLVSASPRHLFLAHSASSSWCRRSRLRRLPAACRPCRPIIRRSLLPQRLSNARSSVSRKPNGGSSCMPITGRWKMVDAEIGRVLDALEDTGLDDETVVIFTSDHGESRGRHCASGSSRPMKRRRKCRWFSPVATASPGAGRSHAPGFGHRPDGDHLRPGGNPRPKNTGRSLRPLLENRPVSWREFVAAEFRVARADAADRTLQVCGGQERSGRATFRYAGGPVGDE